MHDRTDDAGTIQAMLKRLNKQRLPRLLEIERKVDDGELVDETDMRFLQTVKEDAGAAMRLAERNPQIQSLVAKVVQLYDDITRKALENEQSASRQKR